VVVRGQASTGGCDENLPFVGGYAGRGRDATGGGKLGCCPGLGAFSGRARVLEASGGAGGAVAAAINPCPRRR